MRVNTQTNRRPEKAREISDELNPKVLNDAGVREYWIISPEKRIIIVYLFADKKEQETTAIYSFDDAVPCSLWPDFSVRLADHV